VSLALLLVRTDTSADGRQVALLVYYLHGVTHVSHGNLMDKGRYVVLDRTSLDALRNLAVKASLSLVYGLASGVSFLYFLES
jgi:hypothetical protein